MGTIAVRLIIVGIVQGVGFRPFIHRVAIKAGVNGYVRNVGGSEVEVFAEGDEAKVARFLRAIMTEHPPPAVIEEVEVISEGPRGIKGFRILKSEARSLRESMIPPDIAICSECLREVLNPRDRRYGYAFNSCAWCGPRFSMMYRVPYDRENTSMAKYRLCHNCVKEYRDVGNVRRYHAQGISCPKDGPKLWITDRLGKRVETPDPIKEAARLIDEGYIVAVKGLGGYHLAALASDDDVVAKLRRRKRRPQKPFAIMALDVGVARKLVYINELAKEILNSPQRPIVLLPKRGDSPVSRLVSPGLDVEGVFTPYTALHYLLLRNVRDGFLIMTSGNAYGKPMCINEECAYRQLSGIADYFLVHDREIVNRVDDSVVRFTDGEVVMLRRARGYAPAWIRVKAGFQRPVIAFGAELQSAGAVAFKDKVILTQFIGDAEDLDILEDLDRYIKFLVRTYRINIKDSVLVVDKHPHYTSRRLASTYSRVYGSRVVEVQHHYAHVLSVMADRGLIGDVVMGVAIDGVGYGDDGAIWGGEVILVRGDLSYERVGHLEYQPLVGGDASVTYPTRFLTSVLSKFLSDDEVFKAVRSLGLAKSLPRGELELKYVVSAVRRGYYVNTSSIGRVLDAVSSLLKVCTYRSYDGEPAMKLEAYSRGGAELDSIDVKVRSLGGEYVVETTAFIDDVLQHVLGGYDGRSIALTAQIRLGEALAHVVAKHVRGLRSFSGVVVLGGGAAVNTYIVRGVRRVLSSEGIEVLLPRRVPPNDGGVALGQAVATITGIDSL
ncbi:MAG: carbamoyltransferase HypF [Desulfurococcales archaeon ex4484_204]|nr:MAG: carbamoyltransferase HypF [Desulfurococcales archaeon ex4484_204]